MTNKLLKKLNSDTRFISRVVNEYFSNEQSENLYEINYKGKDIDALFIEAQNQVNENFPFSHTELYIVIKELSNLQVEIILWYGSDYYDLDILFDKGLLMIKIEESINDSFAECYLHYKRACKPNCVNSF